jgi:single-strand DNA-binding protein
MDIMGRLTRDAEVRTVTGDKKVVRFSVAVNESYKTKAGERVQKTEYFDCSYWIGIGIAPYLTKGLVVRLTGWLSARAWIDNEGKAHAGMNLQTSKIEFFGTKTTAAEENKEENEDEKIEVAEYEIVGEEHDDLPF